MAKRISKQEQQAQIERNIASGAPTFFVPRGQVKEHYDRIMAEKAAGTYVDNSQALVHQFLMRG
jgi:hypothetical protein